MIDLPDEYRSLTTLKSFNSRIIWQVKGSEQRQPVSFCLSGSPSEECALMIYLILAFLFPYTYIMNRNSIFSAGNYFDDARFSGKCVLSLLIVRDIHLIKTSGGESVIFSSRNFANATLSELMGVFVCFFLCITS